MIHLIFTVLLVISGVVSSQNLKCDIHSVPSVTVNCTDMHFNRVPDYIEGLKDHTKKLILSQNQLNSSVSFANWTFLMSLDLSYNNLNSISNNTVGPLSHLKLLNLSHNNISLITDDAFSNLTVLEILDLSGNPLLGIKIDMLIPALKTPLFLSLKKLTMKSSGLSVVPRDMFEEAHELEHLDLSNNNISEIPILPKGLVYFSMNNNSVKFIDILSFQKSESLKDLYMENNTLLSGIDVDAFEKAYNLRNISLKGCKNLKYIPAHVFYFNKKLKYVSLAGCGLQSLGHSFKSALINAPMVELQDNPWVCNVSLRWFVMLNASYNTNLRCTKPGNYSIMEYYGPLHRHKILGNLLMGLLVIVFVLFGAAIYLSFRMEKRSPRELPYTRLEGKAPLGNGVYLTTVV